jgi:hypothetical protein
MSFGGSPVEFQLKRGEELLGVLRPCGNDFPWVMCSFEPTESFAEVEPLFEEELRLLDAEEMEAWERAYGRVTSLGLRLIDEESGKQIGEFLLHIRGDEAWFRY